MKLKSYRLVCNRKDCGEVFECKTHVIPIDGWHTADELGRKETHLMHVEVDEDERDEN